jgi:NADPH:quinone reductase-like Zn-dependent oxidoreductase
MKAIVFDSYGTADHLHLQDVAQPTPAEDEVLIKVHAVSINDWDWGILQGVPYSNRMTFGLRRPRRHILGSDVAGRVEAVGRKVERLRPGDEVLGDLSGRWGGFAEYVCAGEDALARKPTGMTFVEAAAIPQAATLALQGLRDKGRIERGQRILINGAGGGVGTFGVQLAKLYEAEVTGVDSAAKLDLLRSIGFDQVVDYTQEDFTRRAERYDLILDVKTNRPLRDYLRVLNPGGAYVTVGGATGSLTRAMLLKPLAPLSGRKRVALVFLKLNKDLDYICELHAAGKLSPVIDGPYELAEVPGAMRHFAEGKHQGKVVISLDGGN